MAKYLHHGKASRVRLGVTFEVAYTIAKAEEEHGYLEQIDRYLITLEDGSDIDLIELTDREEEMILEEVWETR